MGHEVFKIIGLRGQIFSPNSLPWIEVFKKPAETVAVKLPEDCYFHFGDQVAKLKAGDYLIKELDGQGWYPCSGARFKELFEEK